MQTSINYITRQRWREKGAVMKFKAERFKNHLKARHKKRKPTSQEQYDLKYFAELKDQQEKLKALDSRVPEQMVFQFDDADKLQEVDNDKS